MTDIRDELARAIAAADGFDWDADLPKAPNSPTQEYLETADAALTWFRAYLQREEVKDRASFAAFGDLAWGNGTVSQGERHATERALAAILPPDKDSTK